MVKPAGQTPQESEFFSIPVGTFKIFISSKILYWLRVFTVVLQIGLFTTVAAGMGLK